MRIDRLVEILDRAVDLLIADGEGAVIVIGPKKVEDYIGLEGAVEIDSKVSPGLIHAIAASWLLGDGAILVRTGRRDARISWAKAMLPLSSNTKAARYAGIRLRGALGLTEEAADAVVIAVEPEPDEGEVAIAWQGRIVYYDPVVGSFKEALEILLGNDPRKKRELMDKLPEVP